MLQPYINNIKNMITHIQPTRNLEYSRSEAIRVLNKYPERIPVIVHRAVFAGDKTPDINCHKFLVPEELTVGQFMYVIRKRLVLAPHEAMFLFINDTIPPTSALMSSIYSEFRNEDTLFLYIDYSLENTFG
jgi:GABA(A) receptor-associated protein